MQGEATSAPEAEESRSVQPVLSLTHLQDRGYISWWVATLMSILPFSLAFHALSIPCPCCPRPLLLSFLYRHSSPPFLFIHSCCQTHPSTRAHLIPFIPLCAHLSLWRSRLYYTCPYRAPLAPSHRDSIQRNRWSCSVLWTSCIRHLERCSGNSSLGIETNEGCHNSNTFIGHMSHSLAWVELSSQKRWYLAIFLFLACRVLIHPLNALASPRIPEVSPIYAISTMIHVIAPAFPASLTFIGRLNVTSH